MNVGIFLSVHEYISKKTEAKQMNDTENYLLSKKSTLSKTIPAGFLVNLIGAMGAFGIVYVLYGIFAPQTRYHVIEPVVYGDFSDLIRSLCLSQSCTVIALAVMFFSTFTVCSKAISFFLCLWRGTCLGCAASLLSSGLVSGISDCWNIGLSLSFFSTVIFIFLSSYSAVYSDCILKTFASAEYRYASSLTNEYIKCFLTLSGGVIIVGIISVILL